METSIVVKEPVLNRVEKAAKQAKGIVTAADISAATGLPIREVESALERMIELYRVSVSADISSGAVRYSFAYPFVLRGSKTWGERWQSIKASLWKGFKVTYKALTGVILAGYTILFAVVLIALAMSGNSDNDSDDFNPGHLLAVMFRMIWEAVFWHSILHPVEYQVDESGMRYRRFKQKEKKKPFIRSVFDFVFGPEQPEEDAEEDAREVAAYARVHKSELTTGDVVALSGVTFQQAEERLADYLVRFKGDAHVREDGAVVADLHALTQRSSLTDEAQIVLYPDEVDPPVVHNGNTGGKNAAIIAMNTFNLAVSSFVVLGLSSATATADIAIGGGVELLLEIGLGYFPFVFSVLFFVIPIGRYFRLSQKKSRREESIIRKKMVRFILENVQRPLSRTELMHVASNSIQAERVLDALVIDLEAQSEVTDQGEVVYVFERLQREL